MGGKFFAVYISVTTLRGMGNRGGNTRKFVISVYDRHCEGMDPGSFYHRIQPERGVALAFVRDYRAYARRSRFYSKLDT